MSHCLFEGCVTRPGSAHCYECGRTDYPLMGWYGAIASAAKRWDVTKDEAEDRIIRHQQEGDLRAAARAGDEQMVADLTEVLSEL